MLGFPPYYVKGLVVLVQDTFSFFFLFLAFYGSQLASADAPPDWPVAAVDTGLVLFLLCRICDGGTSEK